MTQTAKTSWMESNRALLLEEFVRLRNVLSGSAPATESAYAGWDCDQPPAIDLLTEIFRLSAFERDLLLVCAGVEMDSNLAARCGELTGRTQRPSASFGMAMGILANPEWQALSPWAPLRKYRLIEMEPGHGLSTAPLRIDERILHFLAGINRMDARLEAVLHFKRPQGPLSAEQERVVEQFTRAESEEELERLAILLHGDDAEAQETIAARIAHRYGRYLLVMRMEDTPAAGAEMEQFLALWQREESLLPAFLLLHWRSETVTAQAKTLAERITGPLLVASRDPQKLYRFAWRAEVNKPDPPAQRVLWANALDAARVQGKVEDKAAPFEPDEELDATLDSIAEQFRLSAETIGTIANAATAAASQDAEGESLAARLWASCRVVARPQLDLLAERIDPKATWDDLVLPEAQFGVLRMLAGEAQNRMTVYERWGFARRGRRGLGLSALFSGPSGTGKTLAAEVLASELKLDLYRIDLSAVVSKYIGETEKNLKKVFDAAEEGGVVLLFDEAEALFGKRSEVRDSHDRYANIEVGYLLQRMESYQGVAILTTNLKSVLDKAFHRRLRFTVDFPFPGAAERAEIWRRTIPTAAPAKALVAERLAQLNMTGGSIRNIALNAAFLAAAGKRPMTMTDALEAAQLEATKEERPVTDAETRGWR